MSDDQVERPQEIVIVRRRGGGDGGGHHGGAWKIAYADFVTAMMAFFLVMWLINASNEETRAQVASYFNPIKLTDSSTGARGLKDQKDHKSKRKEDGGVSAGGSPPAAHDVKHEAELLANPDKLLAALETKIVAAYPPKSQSADSAHEVAVSDDTNEPTLEIHDPFDPKVRETVSPVKPYSVPATAGTEDTEIAQVGAKKPAQDASLLKADAKAKDHAERSASSSKMPKVAADGADHSQGAHDVTIQTPDEPPAEVDKLAKHDGQTAKLQPVKLSAQATEAEDIAAELAAVLGTGLEDLEASIDIKKTDEGTLISLTDKQPSGMFQSGSAEPQPEMVRLVAAIARVLAVRSGYVVVRGHTDSKPYRNKKYDNWQLSTARAHLAQYMLIRGGLAESRVRRIEGVADREPKIPGDPQAPGNRRIEILLGQDKL